MKEEYRQAVEQTLDRINDKVVNACDEIQYFGEIIFGLIFLTLYLMARLLKKKR